MSRGRPRCTPKPPSDGASPEQGLESARRSSSLPSGVFRTRSPGVEQALADGLADVFLRHMARVRGDRDMRHGEPLSNATIEERNRVSDDDVGRLIAGLRDSSNEPPPSIREGLAAERTWILVHLAFRGNDIARQAAAIELLQAAERRGIESSEAAVALRAFCDRFDDEVGAGPPRSVLLHAVRRAVQAALTTEPPR